MTRRLLALIFGLVVATAGSVSYAAEPPSPERATSDLETQLQRLNDLKARGVISEDEYATLRKAVVDRAASPRDRDRPSAAQKLSGQVLIGEWNGRPRTSISRAIQST